jgi:hypothetical protein
LGVGLGGLLREGPARDQLKGWPRRLLVITLPRYPGTTRRPRIQQPLDIT